MRALVTGGAGFIGSALVDALLERGDEVAVLDDLSTGRRENLVAALAAGATLHEIDITDATAVAGLVAEARPQVVFHLAAQIDVRRSVADPALDAAVNVGGTIALLEACRRSGVRRLVLSSTGGALYGEAERLPTSEDAPLAPMSPYGQSKLAAEGYCLLYARLHGVATICLRYSNVYGPRQDPLGEGGVVAIFCDRALRAEPATIFGDGLQTRDFVYVGDVVEANLRAAGRDVVGSFNIGTAVETTVVELADVLRAALPEQPLATAHAPQRAGEVRRSCLDARSAGRALGWSASTDLRRGLELTLRAQATRAPALG